jgi:hypothetical protein
MAAKKVDAESAAKSAYLTAKRRGKRIPELEPVILKSPDWAEKYAWAVVRGRWKEAEKVIAKDADASIRYALNTLKGRFPLGEKTIIKSGRDATAYATLVVRGRWPLGEKAIARQSWFMWEYAKKALKGPLPKALHQRMVDIFLQDYKPSTFQKKVSPPALLEELHRLNQVDHYAERYCTNRKYMGSAVMTTKDRERRGAKRPRVASKTARKKTKS